MNYPYLLTHSLMAISLAFLVVPAVFTFVVRVPLKKKNLRAGNSALGDILLLSACIAGAVWCLRYAVGMACVMEPEEAGATLNWLEEIGNSILHTLQTFSMDEEYTAYQLMGRELVYEAFGGRDFFVGFYSFYSTVLNLIAPVVGGAAIFEILANIFPKFSLFVQNRCLWRHIYYFSELNEMSLALAKSISDKSPGFIRKNVIVFTNVCKDSGNEQKVQHLATAKALGAICLQEDLLQIRKRTWGNHTFLLIDVDEVSNLQCLAALTQPENVACLNNAQVELFTNDDAYVPLEKELWKKMESQYGFVRQPQQTADEDVPKTLRQRLTAFRDNYGLVHKRMPILVPVKIYRNVVFNMLRKLPLYEPLIGKERNDDGTVDLTVSIVGTGLIGTEMFLTTYWMGQILGCNLKINLLSQESEDSFWSKIDYLNPEIRRTLNPDDPILQINRKGEMSPVYATVSYTQCDVRSSAFVQKLQNDKIPGNLLDTDYFLVALGTDNDNMSVANTIKTYVGQHAVSSRKQKHTALAYVVYDPELADSLNRRKVFTFTDGQPELYMCAVGALDDVFSMENVYMLEAHEGAVRTNRMYTTGSLRKRIAKQNNTRLKDEYNYWASMARSQHFGCKLFASGLCQLSLFDMADGNEAAVWEDRKRAGQAYATIAKSQEKLEGQAWAQRVDFLHKMAWAEHRRWNAFARVYGLRSTFDWMQYLNQTGTHKNMELKLHPCLVECDMLGMRAEFDEYGMVKKETAFRVTDLSQLDLLDELSYRLHDCHTTNYSGLTYDFKQYDYPYYDL